jgi:hypothetical protein
MAMNLLKECFRHSSWKEAEPECRELTFWIGVSSNSHHNVDGIELKGNQKALLSREWQKHLEKYLDGSTPGLLAFAEWILLSGNPLSDDIEEEEEEEESDEDSSALLDEDSDEDEDSVEGDLATRDYREVFPDLSEEVQEEIDKLQERLRKVTQKLNAYKDTERPAGTHRSSRYLLRLAVMPVASNS